MVLLPKQEDTMPNHFKINFCSLVLAATTIAPGFDPSPNGELRVAEASARN